MEKKHINTNGMKIRKALAASTALVSPVLFANSVGALTEEYNAEMEIVQPLGISQTTQMNFGMILAGDDTKVVHLTTTGTSGTATTATMLNTSSMSAGTYKITGSTTWAVNISGANGGSVSGMTFNTIDCKYNNGSQTNIRTTPIAAAAAPGAGKNLVCGAKLQIDGADDGTYQPDFSITIAYD